MKKKITKATFVKKFIRQGLSNREIQDRMAVSGSYIWPMRKQLREEAQAPLEPTKAMEVPATPAATRQEGGDHYKQLKVEPWDIYDSWPNEQQVGAYRANCVKYTLRLDTKDSRLLNARKLAHYAQKLVEVLEAQER